MSVTAGWIILNSAYLIYTISALFKDMLALRATLLAATVLYIAYGIVEPNRSVLLWNLPVAALHMYAIWQLLQARRGIELDDEAEAIQTLLFPTLDRVAFNALWQCSHETTRHDGEILITQGHEVREMSLILGGEVEVLVEGQSPLRLGHVRLIGELSTLRNSAATATVRAINTVRLRVWNKRLLDECCAQNPEVEVALLKVMAREAARKLN